MSALPLSTVPRPRVRLPKPKPNFTGGLRRPTGSTISKVLTTPKSAVVKNEPPKEIKSPPPVRRVVQLEVSNSVQPANDPIKISQHSELANSDELKCSQPTNLLPANSADKEICITDGSLKNSPQFTEALLKSSQQITEVSPEKSPQITEASLSKTLQITQASPKKPSQITEDGQKLHKNPEKTLHRAISTVCNNIKKVRKQSVRSSNENKEKDKVAKVRHKKWQDPPEREKMTMFDLIYWNPKGTPMTYEDDELRVPLTNKEANASIPTTENAERLAEEAVDDPEFVGGTEEHEAEEMEDAMPVPQLKIGPDGNIIVDQQSLVIKTSAAKIDISSSPVVYGRKNTTTYTSFSKKKPTKMWSDKETAKFYVALSSVGTDFSMMANLFPKRERRELKLKFKREEKFNRDLVDKAIRDRQQYDLSIFGESDEEVENQDSESVETISKGRKQQSCVRRRRKKPENDNQILSNKQAKSRKPRGKKKLMQEEDDSEDDEYMPEQEPTELLAKQQDADDTNSQNKEVTDGSLVENPASSSTHNSEENLIESENSDNIEMMEGVLKQTRSGRQPKKRALFTISSQEPKKRAKPAKSNDCGNVSTSTEGANPCASPVVAPTTICSDLPHDSSAQESSQHSTQEITSCAEVLNDITIVESREIELVETICDKYPNANYVEEEQQEEDNGQEYSILQGVLKQTRSGRQPKMKSVFTIDNSTHKKETRERGVLNQATTPTKVTSPHLQLWNPLQSVLATSPNNLFALAETPAEDGSQVVHLYSMSPPVQPSPLSVVESPTNFDHDYVLENLVNLPLI